MRSSLASGTVERQVRNSFRFSTAPECVVRGARVWPERPGSGLSQAIVPVLQQPFTPDWGRQGHSTDCTSKQQLGRPSRLQHERTCAPVSLESTVTIASHTSGRSLTATPSGQP